MKSYIKWAVMLPLIASMSMVSCTKEEDDDPTPTPTSPVEGKLLIMEETAVDAGVDVKVYADEALFHGYNRLYVMLYETGTKTVIKDAHVEFHPEMEMMMGMGHGAPAESPEEESPADGVYKGAVVFVMPSEGNGTWTLGVHVHNHANNVEDEVSAEVTVVATTDKLIYSFVSAIDSMSYFVSLVEPVEPKVGNNDFEIAIHQRVSMDEWPIAAGLKIEMEPEMPSMGHGSPGNVNPVYTSNGHYSDGIVNFTMDGLWYLKMTVKDASDAVHDDQSHFEITL